MPSPDTQEIYLSHEAEQLLTGARLPSIRQRRAKLKHHAGLTGLWLGALLSVSLLCTAVSSATASYPQRTAAASAYAGVLADESVDSGWTGSVGSCQAGNESLASLASTLRTVNALRAFAGVAPVTFDAGMNADAMSAALMTRAAGDLSHSPDTTWPCYSKQGAEASAESNLYLGLSGASAMLGYIEDQGVSTLGHRRWLLDPGAMQFGSGSTGSTNALKVIGSYGNSSRMKAVPADNLVAWPAPGWFPSPWIFSDWSIAIGGQSTKVDVSAAKVSVNLDGSPVSVSGVTALPDGSGTGKTLGWKTDVPDAGFKGDHQIGVSVRGVRIGGAPRKISYTVRVLDPTIQVDAPDTQPSTNVSPPGSASTTIDCTKATAKFTDARRKLAKARRNGRGSAIRKASRNLRAARTARAARCG